MSSRAENFHASPWLGVFYITGGGSPLISELLSTPGASASVLEISVPYAFSALTELLGRAPEQAASATTARQLAATAYNRARQLNDQDSPTLFGFGCTAALGTNRIKKGKHRAHWAIQTATDSYCFSASFNEDRASEEAALLQLFWDSLQGCLLADETQKVKLSQIVELQHQQAPEAYHALMHQQPYRVCYQSQGSTTAHEYNHSSVDLLLPGSFNPIHQGHRQMLKIAEQITGLSGAYELTVKNADKPALDFISLQERLALIEDTPVWLTNTPNFSDKSQLFPNCTFALGVDTMSRIGDLRFYNDDIEQLDMALRHFAERGTKFLVFGRANAGRFTTLKDLNLPQQLVKLCTEVPENLYRNDISSSALRQAEQAAEDS